MPSKRSQSKEREKRRRARLRMTEEARAVDQEKARKRMEKLRAERNADEVDNDNNEMKERIKHLRGIKSKAETEYIKIKKKHSMREQRKLRTGKEHLIDNLEAKKGMRLLTNEGGLRLFSRRNGGKIEKMRDWELYYGSCKNNADKLKAKNPDIIQILNEKFRKEKERDRIRKEKIKEDRGEWLYNTENGDITGMVRVNQNLIMIILSMKL